jgi:hypothetical protein
MSGDLIDKEAHRALERRPFFRRTMRPYRTEVGLFGCRRASIDAEEIFKPVAGERVALRVEE